MYKEIEYRGFVLYWASRCGYWTVYSGDERVMVGLKSKEEAQAAVDERISRI